MKSLRTEGCHVGLFREFVGTACCTYGQSNTTSVSTFVRVTLVDHEGTSLFHSPPEQH